MKSKEDEECITTIFTPKPIESSWQDGARISLSFLNKEFSGYVLQGTGFEPNESFFLALNEEKDGSLKLKEIKARSDGSWNYKTPILPFHQHFGEECIVALHRNQDKDMKMLSFVWGMGNTKKDSD